MQTGELTNERIDGILDQVYDWSRTQHYRGYNKHDGLNSPLLSALLGWAKWPRLVAIQSVMRFPVNLRPLLLIPKTYNPKGIALFAQGLLDRYRASGNPDYLREAEDLLRLLIEIRSTGEGHGGAWGYPYPWQDPGFYALKHTPNAVVTSFVCEAFLDAYRVTNNNSYLEVVGNAIPFFRDKLPVLKDLEEELCLGYMPVPMRMRVMDVSILIGSILSQYAELTGESSLSDTARRLVRFVVNRQTEQGAWYYTDPPEDSYIRHDNYHTGFILDALWRYMQAAQDWSWQDQYWTGLEFYAKHLFNDNGAPRWMADQNLTYDIHGAAQGILTFSRHPKKYPGFAQRSAIWTISSMYNEDGRFHYQRTRFYTKRFTLLRWCNAWMVRALARLRCKECWAYEEN